MDFVAPLLSNRKTPMHDNVAPSGLFCSEHAVLWLNHPQMTLLWEWYQNISITSSGALLRFTCGYNPICSSLQDLIQHPKSLAVCLFLLLTVMPERKRTSADDGGSGVSRRGLGNRRYSIQETLDNCLYKGKSKANLPSTNDWKPKMLGSAHQSWPSDFACCCPTQLTCRLTEW